jgi:hypothetical protein
MRRSGYLRRPPRRAPITDQPRERVESAYSVSDRVNGRTCFNNRPEPETMRLRMSRDDVKLVKPIIVDHVGKSELTREYGFFDERRGLWTCYRMTRQGGVVRYDNADTNSVKVEQGAKDIRA